MKQKGITLVELIVVIAIMAIFSLAVYTYTNSQYNIYASEDIQSQLQGRAKLTVEQIANDIKKARLTEYSVDTNLTETDASGNKVIKSKFTHIDGLSLTDYTPLVYIEAYKLAADGITNSYIYVIRKSDNTLLKVPLVSNNFTMLNTTVVKVYNYHASNYPVTSKFSDERTTSITNDFEDYGIYGTDDYAFSKANDYKFIYECYGKYYMIYCASADTTADDGAATHYQCELSPVSSNVTGNISDGKTIVSNVSNVSVSSASSNNDAFNISVTLNKTANINGTPKIYNRTFTTCASRVRFEGGDAGAQN